MKVQQLIETEIQPSVLPNTKWYHCGPEFEQFSTAFLGSGENNHLLGHGIYFINNSVIAQRYAKYVKSGKPVLYEVQLKGASNSDFYCSRNRPPEQQAQALNKIAKLLGYDDYRSVKYSHSAMKHGRGMVGAVFARFGSQKGAQVLIEHGICGQFEDIGYDGLFELAVWDMSMLQVISKEKLPETEAANTKSNPDIDAWWDEMMKSEHPL